MTEDITAAGRRLVEAHRLRDEAMEQARRFVEALTVDDDPARRAVAAELIEIVGVACLSCHTKCVGDPICETCLAKPAPAQAECVEKAVVHR